MLKCWEFQNYDFINPRASRYSLPPHYAEKLTQTKYLYIWPNLKLRIAHFVYTTTCLNSFSLGFRMNNCSAQVGYYDSDTFYLKLNRLVNDCLINSRVHNRFKCRVTQTLFIWNSINQLMIVSRSPGFHKSHLERSVTITIFKQKALELLWK